MGYIYKIVNQINQKIYVGKTTEKRPTDRYSQHRYLARHLDQDTSNSYIHKAMAKYGLENFKFEIIEKVDDSILNEKECYWIATLNTYIPNGYNLTKGGEGTVGFSRPQSQEEREQKSLSMIKFFEEHPERREQLSEQTKELWKNEEYRKKVTESNKKFYQEHPDMFKGENNPMYGKKHTDEARAKIAEAAKKKKNAIAQLDKDTLEIIQVYDGVKDAEKALGVSHGWISKAARADKVAYGYRWKFV